MNSQLHPRILIHGHRGARGLAPENTLAGFACALKVGVDALELDLRMSADGKIVIHHDRKLNPDLTRIKAGTWLTPPPNRLIIIRLKRFSNSTWVRPDPDRPPLNVFPVKPPEMGKPFLTLRCSVIG